MRRPAPSPIRAALLRRLRAEADAARGEAVALAALWWDHDRLDDATLARTEHHLAQASAACALLVETTEEGT